MHVKNASFGFAWEYNYETFAILMHKCIAAPVNCKAYDPIQLECRLCDTGFMKNSNNDMCSSFRTKMPNSRS